MVSQTTGIAEFSIAVLTFVLADARVLSHVSLEVGRSRESLSTVFAVIAIVPFVQVFVQSPSLNSGKVSNAHRALESLMSSWHLCWVV